MWMSLCKCKWAFRATPHYHECVWILSRSFTHCNKMITDGAIQVYVKTAQRLNKQLVFHFLISCSLSFTYSWDTSVFPSCLSCLIRCGDTGEHYCQKNDKDMWPLALEEWVKKAILVLEKCSLDRREEPRHINRGEAESKRKHEDWRVWRGEDGKSTNMLVSLCEWKRETDRKAGREKDKHFFFRWNKQAESVFALVQGTDLEEENITTLGCQSTVGFFSFTQKLFGFPASQLRKLALDFISFCLVLEDILCWKVTGELVFFRRELPPCSRSLNYCTILIKW